MGLTHLGALRSNPQQYRLPTQRKRISPPPARSIRYLRSSSANARYSASYVTVRAGSTLWMLLKYCDFC